MNATLTKIFIYTLAFSLGIYLYNLGYTYNTLPYWILLGHMTGISLLGIHLSHINTIKKLKSMLKDTYIRSN